MEGWTKVHAKVRSVRTTHEMKRGGTVARHLSGLTVARRLSGLVFGGLLLLGPVTAAVADQPATADEASARAQAAEQRAAQYRELGGVGYKSGLVRGAEAEAAHYDNVAEQAAGETTGATTPTPAPACDANKPGAIPPNCPR